MAAPSRPHLAEPFEERITLLFEELEMAIQFDRPSILLAVYRSEFIREDAEALLTELLRGIGQTVIDYRVANEASADIPLHLVHDYTEEQRAHSVFFVAGLRHGGGRNDALAYYALNIRREYFVDYRIRAVFWLTEAEAQALPRLAPDFWAFRHRSIDLIDAPSPERIPGQARDLAWRDWEDRTLREDTDAKIKLREDLLAELPEGDGARAARFDLLYTLGPLYWAKGDYARAIAALQQAIALDPQDAYPHNGLGNVYSDLKRYDEAIAAYQKAIALDPKPGSRYLAIASIYRHLGDLERSAEYAAQAQERIPADDWYNLACLASVRGDADAVLDYLARAAQSPDFDRVWARKDPDFEWIRDDPRFKAIVGGEEV